MTIVKGNIVVGNNSGRHAIVLAVRKDNTRAKIYEYGPDREVWVPLTAFSVETAGLHQCYKCLGTGLFYMGGATVNGVYTGKTGICFACAGKGEQDDDDRKRCHYYWHGKGADIEDRPLDPYPQQPLPDTSAPLSETPAQKRRKRRQAGSSNDQPEHSRPLDAYAEDEGSNMIDCKGCGTLHRDDTLCPW